MTNSQSLETATFRPVQLHRCDRSRCLQTSVRSIHKSQIADSSPGFSTQISMSRSFKNSFKSRSGNSYHKVPGNNSRSYTNADPTMLERFTSRQGARDRIADVNSRQKPFRSGSIQHIVPVAPVWPNMFGPRVSPQLREVPLEFRLQPSPHGLARRTESGISG